MKTVFTIIGTILLIFAGENSPYAETPAEGIDISVEATVLTPVIGDSLSIIVTVSLSAGTSARSPYIPVESSDFDIMPQWEFTDSTGMGSTRKQYGFLAYVFRPDTLVVGPFMVDYSTSGDDWDTDISDTVTLVVSGIIQGENITPYPNRRPVGMQRGFPWLITAGILAVLSIALYFLLKRKRSISQTITETPVDDLDIFRRIAAMRLYESGEIRRLYILVSDALREFIHNRIGYDARFRTTWEIQRKLNRHSIHRDTIPPLIDLLEESDMVKFARYDPPAKDAESIIDRSVHIVGRILKELERERERIAAEAMDAASAKYESTEPATPVAVEGKR